MNIKKYQRQGRDFWRDQINQYKISGLSQKRFCSQHNLSFSTFSNWKTKLEKESLKRPALVEIPQDLFSPQENNFIELTTPEGISIKISEEVSVSVLQKIFMALREATC